MPRVENRDDFATTLVVRNDFTTGLAADGDPVKLMNYKFVGEEYDEDKKFVVVTDQKVIEACAEILESRAQQAAQLAAEWHGEEKFTDTLGRTWTASTIEAEIVRLVEMCRRPGRTVCIVEECRPTEKKDKE